MFSNLPTPIRRLLTVIAIAAGLILCGSAAGCSAASHGGKAPAAASSAEQQATAPAAVANTQLAKDGYSHLPLPEFGTMAFGIKNASPKYEGIYTYKGTNTSLVQTIVNDVQTKLAGQNVTVKVVNGNLIVVQTDKLSNLKTAAKALIKSAKQHA